MYKSILMPDPISVTPSVAEIRPLSARMAAGDALPTLFMTVRDETAETPCETGVRSPERPRRT
jgi:hypothetical protein